PSPKNIFVIDAGRADEIDLRNKRAAGMLGAKQDYFGHDIIKVGGTERAGEPNLRMIVVANAHKIDVALAGHLPARKKKYIDAALARAIEQLTPAVGEEVVLAALQEGNVRPPFPAFAREQRCGCRNWRCITNRDMTRITDQSCNDVRKKLFVTKT